MTNKTRIKLPEKTAVGDVIEVRALINHVMETGNRKDANGQIIPRNIIRSLTVTFGRVTVFICRVRARDLVQPVRGLPYAGAGTGRVRLHLGGRCGGQNGRADATLRWLKVRARF